MSRNKFSHKRGQKFGAWTLIEPLSQGGNGEVWKVANDQNEEGAIKILKKLSPKAYSRFRDEVEIIKQNQDIEGVIKIFESYLPQGNSEKAWYVMPLAKPYMRYIRNMPVNDKISVIISIAQALSKLHSRGISHRDLKPANLLVLSNKVYLADFGLVDFPTKQDLTEKGEVVGPKWTMAPEMRRNADKANGMSADVYSLAKILWISLTEDEKCFDGQYRAGGSNDLSPYLKFTYNEPLEEILTLSTDHDPLKRPNATGFYRMLIEWQNLNENFNERNSAEWLQVQKKLFPYRTPCTAIWDRLGDIVSILNMLSEVKSLNHMFLPSGGGMDLLKSVESKREKDCIELITSHTINIVKPKRLMFESFQSDSEWNYFRLETYNLEPSGIYDDLGDFVYEELVDVGGKHYADASLWTQSEVSGEPLPKGSRYIVRFLSGDFALFQKTSTYNRTSSTYDGRHSKMDANEFRQHIQEVVNYLERHA